MSRPLIKLVLGLFGILLAPYASGQQKSLSYSVQKTSFNSVSSDMSPVILSNGVAFVSNREDDLGVSRTSETNGLPVFKVYFAEKTDKGFKRPVRFKGSLNQSYSEGPFSISSDAKTIYLSRNIPLTAKSRNGKTAKMALFSARLDGIECGNLVAFEHNKQEFTVAHPSISTNGNFMLFASNLPGGYGGSDLYVTYLKDGKWGKPINLGDEINTPKNEVFPFVNNDGRLFFASDGRGGSGGLDLFSAEYKNFEWREARNLGAPFCSGSDDFGYVESADKTFGYFCSDREGNAKDDIFQFKVSEFVFSECDSLKQIDYCRTFYEDGAMNTDSLPLAYEWDFGNGVKKRGGEVHYCFEKPGKYIVNLNVIDLITNQLFMNEASYELEIEAIKGPYFSTSDTVDVGDFLYMDASRSSVEKASVIKYFWDFGDGTLAEGQKMEHHFKITGDYPVRLGINCLDSSTGRVFTECVVKNISVLPSFQHTANKKSNPKSYYNIKDKKGNVYKIQLATSKEKLDVNATYFKEIGTVEEYYDRGIFGYTVGHYDKAEFTYPELKRVREKGFKEALVIAMNENKVVSGADSSFFVKLPTHFSFLRVVSVHGKVLDNEARPVRATIHLEEMATGVKLGEFRTDSLTGSYELDLPIGKAYAYNIYENGYFPFSNFVDLTKDNDLAEVRSDIFLMSLKKMAHDSMSVRTNNVFFEPDSYVLKTESYSELKRLAGFLANQKDVSFIVETHTDNLGSKELKWLLSKQRAEVIKDILVKNGCPASILDTKPYGESKPLTLSPRMQPVNNRVEIRMVVRK
jgi:outer membrane protein OmpA-like peptidoglycan-associated protein/PKD repeat protein